MNFNRESAAAAAAASGGRGRGWLWAAAALALAAVAVQQRSRAVERAYPPLGRFIEVDGVRLHYVERGRGAPLLLLHGNGSNLLELELSGWLDRAARDYRVIAFDRPGFGYSTRPRGLPWSPARQARLIGRALETLGVEQALVAGHSLGTQVAIELALQCPSQVRALVLASGYYYPTPRIDALLLSPPALPLVGDVMRHTLSPWLSRLIWPVQTRMIFGPAPTSAGFRSYPPWMSLRPMQLRAQAAEMLHAVATAAKLQSRYEEVQVPVSLLAGTDDRFIRTAAQSVRLHRALPGSTLTLVPGAGHMTHHVALEELMTAIDAAAAVERAHAAPVGTITAPQEESALGV